MSWDELLERSRSHADLSESQRIEAAAAFTELREKFGNQIFEAEHPFFHFFLNRAAWTCEWAIWFAGVLRRLEQHADFGRLIADLAKPSKFGERMSVLVVADILSSGGFTFEVDKMVMIDGKPKRPDLFVRHYSDEQGLFVEVSELSESGRELEAVSVSRQLFDAVRWSAYDIESVGLCERVLSPAHLQEVLQTIQLSIQKARQTGFETVEITGVIHAAFATKANTSQLRAWAKAHGLQDGEFRGPSINVSEIDRLSLKLKKEQEQLPPTCPNIVVICSHLFLDSPGSKEAFAYLTQSIEELVYRHSRISYLVLVFRWLGGSTQGVFRFRDHACVNQQRYGFTCSSFLLFKNRFTGHPLPPRTEEHFLKCFFDQAGT